MLIVIDVHGSLSNRTWECTVFHCRLPTSVCQSRWESASCKVLHLCVLFTVYIVWLAVWRLCGFACRHYI